MQWIETLDLYGPTHAEGLTPEQGVELEKKMYDAALVSVKEGYRRLGLLKVTASRRPDYYAEMLKDDKQMTKIRTKLVTAQEKIAAVESRKKKQAQRKFAKQFKAAKIEKKKSDKIAEKLAKPSMKSIDKKGDREEKEGRMGKGKGKGKGKGGKGGRFNKGGKSDREGGSKMGARTGKGGKGRGKGQSRNAGRPKSMMTNKSTGGFKKSGKGGMGKGKGKGKGRR